MQQPPGWWHPAPPPPNIDPAKRRARTARTWWAAAGIAVVVGALWAAVLVLLAYVWFLTIPIWVLIMLVAATVCFSITRRNPSALAYGVAVLCSMALTVGFVVGVLLLAARH
jgi:FtsH-binding integral membrane protein